MTVHGRSNISFGSFLEDITGCSAACSSNPLAVKKPVNKLDERHTWIVAEDLTPVHTIHKLMLSKANASQS